MDPLSLLAGPALGGGGFSGSSSATATSTASVGGGDFNQGGGSTLSQLTPLLIVGAVAVVAVMFLRKG